MKRCTVAVIGHVDHGKTALVRALTGIETDRLKEEQARGLSIALGFAWRDYASGGIDFIDAPGHEDFIRTMVSGASGARAVLLVVSAIDGFERQTIEHLQIAAILGIDAGVVAVTKADLLPPDEIAGRGAEIRRALAATPLRNEPIVFCSARTGAGLSELHEALETLSGRCTAPPVLPGPYLSIDRVFSVRGAGTVVTGTLLGGAIHLGDTMELQPSGVAVTVRGVQARGLELQEIEAGRRTAVNIRGAAVDDLRIGDVLCAPGVFTASKRLDVKIVLSADGARPLKHLEEIRVLFGARATTGTVRLLGGRLLSPGEASWAQVRFDAEVTAFTGQRAVLRRLSPPATIGGALILDLAPSISGRRNEARIAVLQAVETGDAMRIAGALAAQAGGLLSLTDVARLANASPEDLRRHLAEPFETLDDHRLAARGTVIEARQVYLAALADAHGAAPTRPAWPLAAIRRAVVRRFAPAIVEHAEDSLVQSGEIKLTRGRVAHAAHDPIVALDDDARARLQRIDTRLREGGVTPPDPAELRSEAADTADLLDLLVAAGRAVALENHALRKTLLFHPHSLEIARAALAAAFPGQTPFTTGEARASLATSRKFIVPILEHFDAQGWTVRTGDLRRIATTE